MEFFTAPQVGSNKKKMEIIEVSLSLVVGIVLLCLSLTLFVWRKKKKRNLLLKKQGKTIDTFCVEQLTFVHLLQERK